MDKVLISCTSGESARTSGDARDKKGGAGSPSSFGYDSGLAAMEC